ncbi:hypothetical protein CCM_03614 [Cordyceps militaris CM01]|uniref:Uncharacterized protein n=1 Tax=Cordyceps militaris (strain CM01) TaxID=983644 RepID=G3JBX1_CORMM|nr:uncharacterized protein CCM_03614 [Cordyceps militaris CM01]EGX95342.1 hypothetical protein CCM_03614 [Cordyceps militaris CM01]
MSPPPNPNGSCVFRSWLKDMAHHICNLPGALHPVSHPPRMPLAFPCRADFMTGGLVPVREATWPPTYQRHAPTAGQLGLREALRSKVPEFSQSPPTRRTMQVEASWAHGADRFILSLGSVLRGPSAAAAHSTFYNA